MPCLNPRIVYTRPFDHRGDDGRWKSKVVFVNDGVVEDLKLHSPLWTLPCGKCSWCVRQRALDWMTRCYGESLYHDRLAFVTLTYDDGHLNDTVRVDGLDVPQLSKRDLQCFFKRLRKVHPVRYYACGEYGGQFARPHYHAVIFGWDFPDRVPYGRYYLSQELCDFWPHGFSSVGVVTPQSIAYVCGYVSKKVVDSRREKWYSGIAPEFQTMSTKPPLGWRYLDEYRDDFIRIDRKGNVLDTVIHVHGEQRRVPRIFFKKLQLTDPDQFASLMAARRSKAAEQSQTLTTAYLARRREWSAYDHARKEQEHEITRCVRP